MLRDGRAADAHAGGRRTGRHEAVDDDVPVRRRHAGCREHAGARIPQRQALGLLIRASRHHVPRNSVTHVDSPCHIFWDGTMYNGRSHSLVDAATGSGWAAVTAAANGIVTRGVLLDIASVRDVPWLEPGQGVFPDDLEEAERRQGVRVRSGDAVLLRTGCGRARHESGEAIGFTQAGWHASCLPWLQEREVALIGADTPQEVQPSGYEGVLMPVHAVGLVAMGLWLLDNCDLELCATTAGELGQWHFQLAVAPVRFAGTSGSPVNPIATF